MQSFAALPAQVPLDEEELVSFEEKETLTSEKQSLIEDLLVLNRFIYLLEREKKTYRVLNIMAQLLMLSLLALSVYGFVHYWLEGDNAIDNLRNANFNMAQSNTTQNCYDLYKQIDDFCKYIDEHFASICGSACKDLRNDERFQQLSLSGLVLSLAFFCFFSVCSKSDANKQDQHDQISVYSKNVQKAAVNMSQRLNTGSVTVFPFFSLKKRVGELYPAAKELKAQKEQRLRDIEKSLALVESVEGGHNEAPNRQEEAKQSILSSSALSSDDVNLEIEAPWLTQSGLR